MHTTFSENDGFPTFEQIKQDYDELIAIVGEIKTIEQIQELVKSDYGFSLCEIEINGYGVDEWLETGGTNSAIEWIRYDNFGCLSYIYIDTNGYEPMFDVYSEYCDYEFIDCMNMSRLTEDRYEYYKNEAIKHKQT